MKNILYNLTQWETYILQIKIGKVWILRSTILV